MLLRSLGLFVPLAAGGLWFGGAFDAGYVREVDKSPAEVIAALEDLDIREQPGSPGTDASRSGGVMPEFRTEKSGDAISFVVMSGDQVATRMTAHVEPIDGGARTRVTATVERGDAPDERTSPAFRNRGLTMGLFMSAIQDELNELESPPTASAEQCREMLENMNSGPTNSEAAAIIRVHQMEAELRRNGCSTRSGGDFAPVSSQMTGDPSVSGGSGGGWGTQAGTPPTPASGAGR